MNCETLKSLGAWRGTETGRVRDPEGHAVARAEYYVLDDAVTAKLLAAAPRLALACLEALAFLEDLPSRPASALGEKIAAALAAAGVEVGDGK